MNERMSPWSTFYQSVKEETFSFYVDFAIV